MRFAQRIRAVAFDCDGVMFDSVAANHAFYNQILHHFGQPEMTPAQSVYAQMHTLEETLLHLFNTDVPLSEILAYRWQMDYAPILAHMKIEPYLKPLLRRLRPAYGTAIATNRTDTMERVLEAFELSEDFDIVLSSGDVARPKPYPDQLVKIVAHFNLEPENLLFIGDSELDAQAAEAAGTPFAAYCNRNLTADFHVDNLKAVETILEL